MSSPELGLLTNGPLPYVVQFVFRDVTAKQRSNQHHAYGHALNPECPQRPYV